MQPTIGLSTGSPMEEIGEGLKELKEFAIHRKNNNINQNSQGLTTNQRVHMEGPIAPVTYLADDDLV